MRQFRRLFALLFILSLFVGVIHEIKHVHHQGELCEVCVLSHTPVLLGETFALKSIDCTFEPFGFSSITNPSIQHITLRSRSPPLA